MIIGQLTFIFILIHHIYVVIVEKTAKEYLVITYLHAKARQFGEACQGRGRLQKENGIHAFLCRTVLHMSVFMQVFFSLLLLLE